MQAVPIATEVVSSNPVHGDVYSVQHYVIKFVRLATGRLVFFPTENVVVTCLTRFLVFDPVPSVRIPGVYRGGQFYCWKKPEYEEKKPTDLSQV
jgi:hypothetical protein